MAEVMNWLGIIMVLAIGVVVFTKRGVFNKKGKDDFDDNDFASGGDDD